MLDQAPRNNEQRPAGDASAGRPSFELLESLRRLLLTASGSLGLQSVVVDARWNDGAYEVAAAVGADHLLGQVSTAETWRTLLREEHRVSGSYLVPLDHVHRVAPARQLEASDIPEPLATGTSGAWSSDHLLVVPLADRHGKNLGYFSAGGPINDETPVRELVRDLETFARQAAMSLEHAAFLDELNDKVEHLNSLLSMSLDISKSLDPPRTFDSILRATMDLLAADFGTLFLVNRQGTHLELVAAIGIESDSSIRTTMRLGEGVAGLAASSGQPVILQNTEGSEHGGEERILRAIRCHGARSMIHVPIMLDGHVAGAMEMLYERAHAVPDGAVELLSPIAAQAAVAIRNAQLFEDTRSYTSRLRVIQAIASRLNRINDLRSIGEVIAQELRSVIDYHACRVYVVEGNRLLPIALHGSLGEYANERLEEFVLDVGQGATGWVAQHGEPLNLDDAERDPRSEHIPGTEYIDESMLVAPMKYEEQVIGVITLSKLGLGQFTEPDFTLMTTLADQAATAVQNANLFKRIQAEAEALRRSEQRRQLVSLATNDVIWDWNLLTDELEWGGAVQAVFGYTRDDPSDISWWDERIHPEDRVRVISGTQAVIRDGGNVWSDEYRFRRGDGTYGTVIDRGYVVRDEEGRAVRMIGSMMDITERKQVYDQLVESERRFATLLSNTPALVYTCLHEPGWPLLFVSGYAEELTGYSPEELVVGGTVSYGGLILEEDRQRVWEDVQEAVARQERYRLQYRIKRKDGRVRIVEEYGQEGRDASGRVALEGIILDITEREEAQARLAEAETRYRTLVERMPAVTFILADDDVWSALYMSPQVETMLGYAPDEWVADRMFRLNVLHPDDRQSVLIANREAARTGNPFKMEYRVIAADGRVVWVRDESVLVRGEDGHALYWQGVYLDITARKELEKQLEHQAFHDTLTGLPNRALFVDRLEHALARSERGTGGIAVLFLDLDRFKYVNDSLGHEVGDQLLVVVGKFLQGCVRPGDTVARLGGDEFTILLEDVERPDDAVCIAERITEGLRTPFTLKQHELYITTSIGIVFSSPERNRTSDLLRSADMAMYRAKSRGRARYEVFDISMTSLAVQQLETDNDLRRAIERDEFRILYQPYVELGTGRIVAMEALVRWEHPQRGVLLPQDFIPLAEETGLVAPIGRWVLEEACRQGRLWQRTRPDDPSARVSVNLSAKQFGQAGIVRDVADALQRTDLAADNLYLEITESTAMGDAAGTSATLRELKSLGVHLVIDDFGTGYSSLSYLKRFPVDALKIDKSFVDGLGEDEEDTAIVRAVITLAKALGIEVVAEGVETAQQVAHLWAMGCTMGQGSYFSEPLPGDAATALIARGAMFSDRWSGDFSAP